MPWCALLLLLSASQIAAPARVLGIFPYGGVSHFYVFRPLMEELAKRGHDVHVVGHHPREEPMQNYTDVSLRDLNFPSESHMDFEVPLMEELASRGHHVHVLGHFPRKERMENYTDVSLKDLNFPSVAYNKFERPLMEELVSRGHRVHVLGHFPRKERIENYTDVSLKDLNFPSVGFKKFERFESMETSWFTNLQGLLHLGQDYDKILTKPEVLELTNTTFDLVIMEMFNSDLFYALSYKIGAPVIGFSSCQMLSWAADSMAVPNDLPYFPHLIGGHGIEMDFLERLMNTVELWLERAFYRFVIHRDSQALAERYLGPLPPLADIAANTSLLLVNSHFSLFGLHPLPPSIIEVGGINVHEPKPLPEDLAQICNNSKGVIYFSMGSVMKGSSLPSEKQKMFTNALAPTGRTVLWKREDHLKTTSNIHARSWFPQRDILAHRKTELFISHCGLLGVNEAVASGVPIICIPMFGDQIYNAKHIVRVGAGLMLRYSNLTEQTIREAVNEVLNNKIYKERARELSDAFRDRPMSPLETAVFWVEYHLKHGPRPFAAPVKQMPFWQRIGIDIAATILAALTLFMCLLMLLLKACCFTSKHTIKEKQH